MSIKNPLTQQEHEIIDNKHTEAPFTGEYDDFFVDGVYFCKKCSSPLFSSEAKFHSGCGWPSFDENFPNAIERVKDKDGQRTEIVCSNCHGHLGHVFEGEQFTNKNTRHCVNSLSIKFVPQKPSSTSETIYLGGGCFWCVDAAFRNSKGVTQVESGYAGGTTLNPTYEQVSRGDSGHAEVVKIEFDNTKTTLTELLAIFFKIHDPTTLNKQGNDIGTQYRSVILYTTLNQKEEIENTIQKLQLAKYEHKTVVTQVLPLIKYFPAESYHQDYYNKNPNAGYCQFVIKPKLEKLN